MWCVYYKDGTYLKGDICITGNLCAGDNVTIDGIVDAAENVFFGDSADVGSVFAGGGNLVDDKAHVATFGNIEFGKNSNVSVIEAEGKVTMGEESYILYLRRCNEFYPLGTVRVFDKNKNSWVKITN